VDIAFVSVLGLLIIVFLQKKHVLINIPKMSLNNASLIVGAQIKREDIIEDFNKIKRYSSNNCLSFF